MKKIKIKTKTLIPVIILLSAAVIYYTTLPAINIHDIRFWFMLIFLMIELLMLTSFRQLASYIEYKIRGVQLRDKMNLGLITKITLGLIAICMAYIIIVPMIFSPIFMSKTYSQRINVSEVNFSEIPAYNFNTTAIIDRSSAEILGNKVMGEMADLVSQFEVSNEYSQISYKEGTYRVTPLTYSGFIKYLKNRSEGIPGYIIINTTTGETKLNRLTEKMRYVPSGYFNEYLNRKLRFSYPFDIFSEPSFEIDENGKPYYVCTTYTFVGCNTLRRVTGVVLFDPVSGESQKYSIEEAPSWVDRIYPESLVREEIDDYGHYRGGFLNSIFTQDGVIQSSDGYNYISKEGDIWLYTGMTSVVSDSSNIGFMLVNLRTHEAQIIPVSGADENSAMYSAEGEVLNYGYTATFPVLINASNKPFYILSLKDTAGLVKMYALVDAQDYQQVYTIKADKDAKSSIEELIRRSTGETVISDNAEMETKTITVEAIREANIDGTTYYYILFDNELYQIKADLNNIASVIFLQEGQQLAVECHKADSLYIVETIIK